MPRALILGGTGVIGRATAGRLLAAGWHVQLTGRDPRNFPASLAAAGATFLVADRHDPVQLRAAVGSGADLIVDCVCYTAADAAGLLPLLRDTASAVMLSSQAVYVDDLGNHNNSETAPRFRGPIGESQPTVGPSDVDYQTREGYGQNKVAAERVLLDSGAAVTVLRAAKVHGVGARRAREWVFVKRVLDQRPAVFLARRGASVAQTTAAANTAALIQVVAAKPGSRILNSADPDAPSALDISRAIARHLGHAWDEVLLDGGAGEPGRAEQPGGAGGNLGDHPWNAPHPMVLDTTAATDLGYAPVGDYAATVTEEVDWLVSAVHGGEGAELLPEPDDPFLAQFLDYGAEDRYLVAHPVGPRRS